jgi:hypothetical protein
MQKSIIPHWDQFQKSHCCWQGRFVNVFCGYFKGNNRFFHLNCHFALIFALNYSLCMGWLDLCGGYGEFSFYRAFRRDGHNEQLFDIRQQPHNNKMVGWIDFFFLALPLSLSLSV